MDTDQAVKISRVAAADAARAGGEARRAGTPLSECPYADPGTDPVGREFLAFFWRKGWANGE